MINHKIFRSKRVTDSAKFEDCSLRLPNICNYNSATVVFAHLPSVAKGYGIKSPDYFGVYACSKCHDILDNRVYNKEIRKEINEHMLLALFETQKKLFDKNILGEIK